MSFDCILQFLPTYLFTPLSGRAKVTNILSFLYASKWQQQFLTWTTTIHIVSELGHLLFWSHFLPLPHSIRQQSNFDKWCLHSQSRIARHHHFSGQRHHNLCHTGQNHTTTNLHEHALSSVCWHVLSLQWWWVALPTCQCCCRVSHLWHAPSDRDVWWTAWCRPIHQEGTPCAPCTAWWWSRRCLREAAMRKWNYTMHVSLRTVTFAERKPSVFEDHFFRTYLL